MSRFFVYLKLEIKKALKTIPYLLIGAIVLSLMIGIIAFCASKILYQNKLVKEISVGVVLPDDDPMAELALSWLSSMESVKSVCEFIYLDEETAVAQLERKELYGILVIPSKFVQGILDSTNTPIIVILPEDIGIEASLLKELTDAGGSILGSAQAGIYAATDYCISHDLISSIPEMEDALNKEYMNYTLSRASYFRNITVSATGELTVMEYYIAAAFLLFLLFCGIPCASLLKKEPKAFLEKLRIAGIHSWQVVISKIIGVGVILSIVVIVMGGLALGIWYGINGTGISIKPQSALALLPVILAVAATIVFIYEAMGSLTEGVMLLFLSTVAMLFLSGGFIPISFLPAVVGKVSPFVPTTILLEQIGTMVTEEVSLFITAKTCLVSIIFYGLAVVVRR